MQMHRKMRTNLSQLNSTILSLISKKKMFPLFKCLLYIFCGLFFSPFGFRRSLLKSMVLGSFLSPNRIYTKKTPARYRRSVDIKITYETASIHEIKNYNMDTVAIEQQGRRIKFASS